MKVEFIAGPDDDDRRLESVLRRLLPGQPLGSLHKALRQGDVRLNGAKAGPESKVSSGDRLSVWDALVKPESATTPPRNSVGLPPEWILHDGGDLVVINKPSGLLVHRGDGSFDRQKTAPLDDLVRAWLAPSGKASLSFRPGPLHRLDRETSGLIVFSRTLLGARAFSAALAGREVSKTYLAVLRGDLELPQEVRAPLSRDEASRMTVADDQGEQSVTRFRPLARASGLTLVEIDLGTGRTHQIRAHAQILGFPLAGDSKYGGQSTPEGLDVPWLLHAWKLSTPLLPPLKAPLPEGRTHWIKKTFKISP